MSETSSLHDGHDLDDPVQTYHDATRVLGNLTRWVQQEHADDVRMKNANMVLKEENARLKKKNQTMEEKHKKLEAINTKLFKELEAKAGAEYTKKLHQALFPPKQLKAASSSNSSDVLPVPKSRKRRQEVARKSTGGKAPRKQLAAWSSAAVKTASLDAHEENLEDESMMSTGSGGQDDMLSDE